MFDNLEEWQPTRRYYWQVQGFWGALFIITMCYAHCPHLEPHFGKWDGW